MDTTDVVMDKADGLDLLLTEFLGALQEPAAVIQCRVDSNTLENSDDHDPTLGPKEISVPTVVWVNGQMTLELKTSIDCHLRQRVAGRKSLHESNGPCKLDTLVDKFMEDGVNHVLRSTWHGAWLQNGKFLVLRLESQVEERVQRASHNGGLHAPPTHGRSSSGDIILHPAPPHAIKADIAMSTKPDSRGSSPLPSAYQVTLPESSSEADSFLNAFNSKDWASTPLGPMESWPESLMRLTRLCLICPFPVILYWGPNFIQVYNEAFTKHIGKKHPAILGMSHREAWPEVSHFTSDPLFKSAKVCPHHVCQLSRSDRSRMTSGKACKKHGEGK